MTRLNNPSKKIKKHGAFLLLALTTTSAGVGFISALMPLPAHAQDEPFERNRIVRYGDLNLASQQGVDTLRLRIHRAAKSVCSTDGIANVANQRQIRQCIAEANVNAWAVAERRIEGRRLASRLVK